MPPSDIYLVRHAQSEWNAAGLWQGQADPPLSVQGIEQAAELARRFPAVDVTHVVTSDLRRARATAQPLASSLGAPLTVDPDLREIDVGSWSGRTRDEIEANDPGSLDLYFRGREGWTGGETYAEHSARSARAAATLASLETDEAVVAISHGGTIRALVLALLELPAEHRTKLSGIRFTSITQLARGPHGWRLVSFNAEMPPTPRTA